MRKLSVSRRPFGCCKVTRTLARASVSSPASVRRPSVSYGDAAISCFAPFDSIATTRVRAFSKVEAAAAALSLSRSMKRPPLPSAIARKRGASLRAAAEIAWTGTVVAAKRCTPKFERPSENSSTSPASASGTTAPRLVAPSYTVDSSALRNARHSPFTTVKTCTASAASRTRTSLTSMLRAFAKYAPSKANSRPWSRPAPEPELSQTSETTRGSARGAVIAATGTSARKKLRPSSRCVVMLPPAGGA